MDEARVDVVVVGGGLAGLAAAAYLARAGRRVVVLEKASEPGGRAVTQEKNGFCFNLGPHALYRGGAAAEVLRELGVAAEGGVPAQAGFALEGGAAYALPAGPLSLLTTGLLGLAEKVEAGRFLASLSRIDPAPLAGVSVADWLASSLRHPAVRRLAEAFVRVTTYAHDPGRLSAGAAVAQLALGQKHGVLYLHGGWRTLVDGLRRAAETAGARLVARSRVVAVDSADGTVHLADGGRWHAGSVVLAVSSAAAAEILDDEGLRRCAAEAVPVRVACFDVALARLPRPEARFALGIDRPLYASVHSAIARLAPPGGALIHVARYLGPEAADTSTEAELAGVLDGLQPGWRALVVHRRFLPDLTVSPLLPTSACGGLAGRPGPVIPGHPRVVLAGDWVGPEGLLADAALASARAAVRALLARDAAAAA